VQLSRPPRRRPREPRRRRPRCRSWSRTRIGRRCRSWGRRRPRGRSRGLFDDRTRGRPVLDEPAIDSVEPTEAVASSVEQSLTGCGVVVTLAVSGLCGLDIVLGVASVRPRRPVRKRGVRGDDVEEFEPRVGRVRNLPRHVDGRPRVRSGADSDEDRGDASGRVARSAPSSVASAAVDAAAAASATAGSMMGSPTCGGSSPAVSTPEPSDSGVSVPPLQNSVPRRCPSPSLRRLRCRRRSRSCPIVRRTSDKSRWSRARGRRRHSRTVTPGRTPRARTARLRPRRRPRRAR